MTWTAPAVRIKPPYLADERTRLDASPDYHRATLLGKCGHADLIRELVDGVIGL